MSVATGDIASPREKISKWCLMIQQWLGNMSLPRTTRHTSGAMFSPLEEPYHLCIQRARHLGTVVSLSKVPSLMKEVGLRADMMTVTRPWKVLRRPGP